MKRTATILLVILCAAGTAAPATIEIEAEDFECCYDCGLDHIQRTPAPIGTGLAVLIGLDCPDEWIEYLLEVDAFGEYGVVMRARGNIGVHYQLRLTLTGHTSGQSQTVDLIFDGAGYG
jgi:hypothetical protein